jgi:hypothetical protein
MNNIRPRMRVELNPLHLAARAPKPPKLTELHPEVRSFFAQFSGSGAGGRFVRGQALPAGGHFWQDVGRMGRNAVGTAGQWGRNAMTTAGRLAMTPRTWVNLGTHAGMGMAGMGVTGGLNWLGGKINPKLQTSDNYAGAAYGVFTDAAGGAVTGMRGGPLGAAVGAVSGMVLGDAVRYYRVLRDIHQLNIHACGCGPHARACDATDSGIGTGRLDYHPAPRTRKDEPLHNSFSGEAACG